jgi:hypothetical protein
LLITIFRLTCAVFAVLSTSLKFLSLRTGAVIFISRNSQVSYETKRGPKGMQAANISPQ